MNILSTILAAFLIVCSSLFALPRTALGQFQIGNVFASVNGNTQNGGGFLNQYTPTGTQIPFPTILDRPRGVLFDNSGNLFVATTTFDNNVDDFVGSILKIDSNGNSTPFATGFGAGFFLESLAMDGNGDLFVMAGEPNASLASTIFKVASNGGQPTMFASPSSTGFPFFNGFGLAFDSAGNLYASFEGDLTIYKFSSANGVLSNVPTIFVGPADFAPTYAPDCLVFDSAGNLFVSADDNNGNGEILEFDPTGAPYQPTPTGTSGLFATGQTSGNTRGLAFDARGNLFAGEPYFPNSTNSGGDILKFCPDGTKLVFAAGLGRMKGGGGAEFVAVVPGSNTPTIAGSNATNLGAIGFAGITVDSSVTTAGTTTVVPINPNTAGTLPSAFELAGIELSFDISTTANFSTPIIISFQMPSALDASQLSVWHNEGGILVNRTLHPGDSDYPSNPTPNTVYASVGSLSPFVIAKSAVPTNINQCKNGGWETRGRANATRFKNQGDCIQYVNTGK